MVQNGFSLLFLLVFLSSAVSLLFSIRGSWSHIVDALAVEPAEPEAAVYSTTQRPAAEVPWVARRLVLRELDEALPPSPSAFPAWTVRPLGAAAGPQMDFAFAEHVPS